MLKILYYPFKVNNNLKFYIIYTLFILLIYFPLITQQFAMTDDYVLLDLSVKGDTTILQWDILNGRPFYGVMQYFIQSYITSFKGVSWLRLFSVLSTIFFCCFVLKFLQAKVETRFKSFVLYLPVFLILLPPVAVYNSWGVCFPYMLALFLAGLAYHCMFDRDRNTTIVSFVVGQLLLIFAFFIYQPSAMCYLYFVFLNYCIDSRKIKYSGICYSFIAIVIGMFSALLAVKLLPKYLYGTTLNRSEISLNVFNRLNWFVHGPFKIAIYNYDVTHNLIYGLVSIVLICVGAIYILKERQGIFKFVLTLVLILGIISPSLVVQEEWVASRSAIGLYFVIITIILYGLISLYQTYINSKLLKNRIRLNYLLVCLLTIAGIYTQYYLLDGTIKLQQSEYQAVKQEVMNRVSPQYTGRIRFDVSGNVNNFATKIHMSDEIGISSIHALWAIRGEAYLIKKTKHLNYMIDDSNLVLTNNECKDNCIVIDVTKALSDAK